MSQAKTLNCWEQFLPVLTVALPHPLYLWKRADPSPRLLPVAPEPHLAASPGKDAGPELGRGRRASGPVISEGTN